MELLALLLSPVIAVAVGEWLRTRNYNKQQRNDLLRRLISYGYQMSPGYSGQEEILMALNEIKYWYSSDFSVKSLLFLVMDTMQAGGDAQNDLIKLIQTIAMKEKHLLTREDVERVFSTRGH